MDFDAAPDSLDLSSLAYIAKASATLSGSTLTLKDGTYTASFTLAGNTVVTATAAAQARPIVHASAAFDAYGSAPASQLEPFAGLDPDFMTLRRSFRDSSS